MDKNDVLQLLRSITYPGFSRDIVSFGMVTDVVVDKASVLVRLRITTTDETKKRTVVEAVRSILEKAGGFHAVSVELVDQPARDQPSSQVPPGGVPAPDPLTGVRHVIAVASGKGGVGKSTIAANLALALKQHGYTVGLLDLDIYGPSLPTILGVNEHPQITAHKKLVPLDCYGLKVMSFGFISGNTTPVIWRGPLVARMTEQFFNDVEWGTLDYLVLDLPPGTGDVQLTLTQKVRISGAIIVTTPQDIALTDVRKGADMFRKVQAPVLGVIENMSGFQLQGRFRWKEGSLPGDLTLSMDVGGGEEPVRLDEAGRFQVELNVFKRGGGRAESERLGVPLLGEIPLSPALMEATDAGTPLGVSFPDAPLVGVFQSIAERVIATCPV